ncbi:MAG: efflux RND transporter periplasmic adaptor subunit [Proteobacteria bacterium]|nr:efflux RND transporter periplasmic adaptor subunit [Pseudomonadota bacterium]
MPKKRIVITVALLLALVIAFLLALNLFQGNDETVSDTATFAVKKGPLTISVTESGTIKAREQAVIKNEVEGKTTILTLVSEGDQVKKGDMLIELDASGLIDNKIDQQIKVQNVEASFVGARENLAVVRNQAQSDVDQAELTLEFAGQDLKKYLEGEYPNQKKQAQAKITLAEEELARASEKLKWSKTLQGENYLSYTELQADELAEKKAALDLEMAKNELSLLEDFTYQRNLAELKSKVKEAEMALERTGRKARANVVQAEADLKAKESEFEQQKSKLQKTERQIEKAKIYAPSDGQVIYATSARMGGFRSNVEPLEVGREVRESEELIHLPTTTSVNVEFSIHEASLKKVRPGLPARVTVDALPGKVFTGSVAVIAPLPDARSAWMNPDLKVYRSELQLDGNQSGLRAGMSCRVEIIVAEYDEVVYVPVQAVARVGSQTGVYVMKEGRSELRAVEIGLDNNRVVHIKSGLQEGDIVSLTPSLAASAVEPTAPTGRNPVPDENSSVEKKRISTDENPANGEDKKPAQPGGEDGLSPNISPQDREKLREQFKNMSPEERQKRRQEMGRSR